MRETEAMKVGKNKQKQHPRSFRRRVKLAGGAFILLIVLAAMELSSYVLGVFYVVPRANFIFYRKPASKDVSKQAFEEYSQRRHPVLGWPSPSEFGGERFDSSGSRWIPSFPAIGTEVVSLYGDSYTYAEDVGHEEAWSNVLSKMMGGRVANFGVGAYGTDQAYLRFKQNTGDRATTVILCIYPDNLKRNVNQQRYFLVANPRAVFGFKPRFILTEEAMELRGLPTLHLSDCRASFNHPENYFDHEFFLPGTPNGPICWSFPYTICIFKAAFSPQVRDWRAGKPGWFGFAQDGHPSDALTLTARIAHEFVLLAQTRHKKAVVVLLPSQTSYEFYVHSGTLAIEPLLDKLKEITVDVHDLTEGIRRHLSGRPYSELKVSKASGHPHFNAEGNRLVAELVYPLVHSPEVDPPDF